MQQGKLPVIAIPEAGQPTADLEVAPGLSNLVAATFKRVCHQKMR